MIMRYVTFFDILRIPIVEHAVNRRRLSTVIDDAERAGRLTLTTAQIAELLPGVSPDALRQALLRQQRRGRLTRCARGAGQGRLVPLMHAGAGAPPIETWLPRLVTTTLTEQHD